MDRVDVAIVGCGIFCEVHAKAYRGFSQSNLVAVCDIDARRARQMAEKYACRYSTNIEEIACDPQIQAVSVVTPDFTHVEPCVVLAQAGKHLLIEKPLATSVADAEKIVAAVTKAGVICMVDFHNRYNPAFAPIKEQLDHGQLGRPQMMYVRLSDRIEVASEWFNWSGKSGPEWFLGSHIADLACWLFGELPVRVFADGQKEVLAGKGIDCYDSVQIHLSFAKGMATLETSWIVPNSWPAVCNFYASLQTTTGRADVELGKQATTIARADGFEWPFILGQTAIGAEEFGFFKLPIRDFVRAVARGAGSPIGVQEGLNNVRIIAAALESMRTKQVVELSW